MGLLWDKEKALLKSALGSVLSQQENSFVLAREIFFFFFLPILGWWRNRLRGKRKHPEMPRITRTWAEVWTRGCLTTKLVLLVPRGPHCLWSCSLCCQSTKESTCLLGLTAPKPPGLIPPIPEGKRQLLKMINKKSVFLNVFFYFLIPALTGLWPELLAFCFHSCYFQLVWLTS